MLRRFRLSVSPCFPINQRELWEATILTSSKFTETRVAVCVADVVGKGITAALLMANVQTV
jgi:serine phosphatase RsbU (regulator of sigma subunit)